MCLVALAIDTSRRFPLVIASNRDEFFDRPSAPLDVWSPRPGAPPALEGRDLESGGTWLGLGERGRLALLTNVRSGKLADPRAPSRGAIVTDWLTSSDPTARFWTRTALGGHNGFNLIAADFRQGECVWATNTGALPRHLSKGLYGLSNGGLDAPWPKVLRLKARLGAAIAEAEAAPDRDELAAALFAALADRRVALDAELPHTGIPLERERALSPAFIAMPAQRYGTRCSTLVITERVGRGSSTRVFERSFDAAGEVVRLRAVTLPGWPPPPGDGATPFHAITVAEPIV